MKTEKNNFYDELFYNKKKSENKNNFLFKNKKFCNNEKITNKKIIKYEFKPAEYIQDSESEEVDDYD